MKLRNYPLANFEENRKLPQVDPARAIIDIVPHPNGFPEFGRSGHVLGARKRQELFAGRMLQDSLDRILISVVRGDGEAGDFQVGGLNIENVTAP